MIDVKALETFKYTAMCLGNQDVAGAERQLRYAVEKWPEQCDLQRLWALLRFTKDGQRADARAIARIRDTLDTYDDIVTAVDSTVVENLADAGWTLPLLGVQLPLRTRGQIRAAHAAGLIMAGRYDEAREELDRARGEKVVLAANTETTRNAIAAVECLLYYRTERWSDLITASTPLTSLASPSNEGDEATKLYAAIGTAFYGTATARLGNHKAGQISLQHGLTTPTVFPSVGAWTALQLGLSLRTEGNEDKAQEAFAVGLQLDPRHEGLTEAIRNPNVRLRASSPDLIAERTSFWDPDSEPDLEDFRRTSSQSDRREVLDAAMRELEALEGMEEIKDQIRTLQAALRVENEMRRRGRPVEAESRHIVFKGPPGTGKTTIARLIGRLYYGLGVTETPTVIEGGRESLIGKFVGHSGAETKEAMERARGGILFIDEAYELVQDSNGMQADQFGNEALTTLLAYMENWRDQLVVIVAGYEAEMDRFLSENPGLKSRFAYYMTFSSYTPAEMWNILTGMAQARSKTIDPAAKEWFTGVIEVMRKATIWEKGITRSVIDAAGNARFARNVVEQANKIADVRRAYGADMRPLSDEELQMLSDEELSTILVEDVAAAVKKILAGYGLTSIAGPEQLALGA